MKISYLLFWFWEPRRNSGSSKLTTGIRIRAQSISFISGTKNKSPDLEAKKKEGHVTQIGQKKSRIRIIWMKPILRVDTVCCRIRISKRIRIRKSRSKSINPILCVYTVSNIVKANREDER